MDETQVRINNKPVKVIARKEADNVFIQELLTNFKEGFTTIATCSIKKKFTLYVLAKGRTERCTFKFHYEGMESEVFSSSTGWNTTDVMEDYLEWLSLQMNREPFVLIGEYLELLNEYCEGLLFINISKVMNSFRRKDILTLYLSFKKLGIK